VDFSFYFRLRLVLFFHPQKMLQKLKLASSTTPSSTPIDLPAPPTVDQMSADLSKLRSNDPIFQLAPLDYFSKDFPIEKSSVEKKRRGRRFRQIIEIVIVMSRNSRRRSVFGRKTRSIENVDSSSVGKTSRIGRNRQLDDGRGE